MINLQEQRLLSAARQGDQDAFSQLVHAYEKRIFNLCRRMCRCDEDAEEAAQEAFLSAWRALPDFRGDAAFSTWLYRLACNACNDLLRRESRRSAHAGPSLDDEEAAPSIPDESASPQVIAERNELRRQVRAALDQLSPEHREILILREMQQLSYEEISGILHLDGGTVRSRISRARTQLRSILLRSGNFSRPASSNHSERGCGNDL